MLRIHGDRSSLLAALAAHWADHGAPGKPAAGAPGSCCGRSGTRSDLDTSLSPMTLASSSEPVSIGRNDHSPELNECNPSVDPPVESWVVFYLFSG